MEFSNKTFLVIDDFQGMRTVLRDILRSMGVNPKLIATAANGNEAITLLAQTRFDGVLCDFNLGHGKNGQQILEEAKYRNLVGPSCAWVMITAEKTADVVMGAAEYQPDAYLLKPITESTLRLRLEKIWAKKSAFIDIDQAVMSHDLLQAIRLCDERLAVDKANAGELLRLKCHLLLVSGEHEQARALCQALLAKRDIPWAQLALARVHIAAGELEEARQMLENLVADNRSYLEAHDWLANVHNAQGDLHKAEEVLEMAARLSPHSVIRQKNLGEVSLQLGKVDKAERAFRKSVALGEHSILKTPDAYLGLARACSAQDNPKEALQVLGSLSKQFEGDDVKVKAMATEGMVHHRAGDTEAARRIAIQLGDTLGQHNGPQVESAAIVEMAELMMVTGEKERAAALLQSEVRNNPDDRILLERIQTVFDTGAMSEEGSALVEASRKEAVQLMNQGVLLARDEQYEEALAAMRDACERLPGNVRVLFNFAHLGMVVMRKTGVEPGLVEEIRQHLQTAHRIAPVEKRYAQLMSQLKALAG
ncbi:response regulator [Azospira sp. I13]|uniref:tetratricopeptide repeat-containing response regulator n=1 Tax=Azospira sp. I13 TaxID=1765050 RepID=UPI000D3F6838|nr:tetratricopeptide repeat-containing response regulator [Azospira sp. I13]GBG01943.1 response regulator [Azospira sp. I13]